MGFSSKKTITLIPGDGVGTEVTQSACTILKAAGAAVEWEICDAGSAVFKRGLSTGVPQETIDSLNRNKVALKGPLETPVGYGEKSANVTLRKLFETYGNIRPVKELEGVVTPYLGRGIDLIIVRENVEDLYAGIEYAQTPNSAECLKLISRHGCEKIIRLAFEFAIAEGRQKVHCASKANIMKMTEGLLKRTFEEVAKDYPSIQSQHIIVDNCAHQLVKKPEQFDVIVTTNMNGDILSDLSSALVGGLGFAPSANIGDHCTIFEAVHGSAPKHAGQNTINPTAMILSAVMMLRYLKQFETATKIDQALRTTLKQGALTSDASGEKKPFSTTDFTQAVIDNLGKTIKNPATYKSLDLSKVYSKPIVAKKRLFKGIDIYIETTQHPQQVGDHLTQVFRETCWKLESLACRGLTVYPFVDVTNISFTDLLQCRFFLKHPEIESEAIAKALHLIGHHYHWMHVEKLQAFDEIEVFSASHGA